MRLPPRPTGLPDYEHPPVDEVVLGLGFESILGLAQPHIGLLWSRLREQFPTVRDVVPLVDPTPGGAPIRIEMGPGMLARTFSCSNVAA